MFDFPGAWGLELRDVKSPATLLIEGDFVGWDAQGLVARNGGYLKHPGGRAALRPGRGGPGGHHPRVRPTTSSWTSPPPAPGGRCWRPRGSSPASTATGSRTGEPEPPSGIDMHAEFTEAADALAAVAAGPQAAGLRIGRATGDGRRRSEGRLRAAEDRRAHRGAGRRLRQPVPGARSRACAFALDLGRADDGRGASGWGSTPRAAARWRWRRRCAAPQAKARLDSTAVHHRQLPAARRWPHAGGRHAERAA